MTSTPPPHAASQRRSRCGQGGGSPAAVRFVAGRRRQRRPQQHRVLARYTDGKGRPREVLTRPGAAGSVLVIDRDTVTRSDRRLLAHLGVEEPLLNATLVCRSYLQETQGQGCRCRVLSAEDSRTVPFADPEPTELDAAARACDPEPRDRDGRSYRLGHVDTGRSIPELRWHAHSLAGEDLEPHPVSVREAVARLERYEPVRTLTLCALARHRATAAVSRAVLRAELERLQESPIVLNWRLREAVIATIERNGLSMSEIAIRCGRVKRDRSGHESGETSWLARRLGLLVEAGRDRPTPWIHTDVLALIARCGLGVSPREVEA